MIHIYQQLTWVDPSQVLWGCVDGRSSKYQLGTLGGDVGEFLTGIATLAKINSINGLSPILIDNIFTKFITIQPDMYYHTDDYSVAQIVKILTNQGIDMANFSIWAPTSEQKPALLDLLVDPNYTGCSHIRQMLNNPGDYQIPKAYVQQFLKSYFNNLWSKTESKRREQFEVLEGKSLEIKYIEINMNRENVKKNDLQCSKLVPTASPHDVEESFIVHCDDIKNSGIRGKVKKFIEQQLPSNVKSQSNSTFDDISKQQQDISYALIGVNEVPKFYHQFKVYTDWAKVPADEFPSLEKFIPSTPTTDDFSDFEE
ncbi:hypothetical protein PPL_06180 [Heterostelium album PN500]|uniref:Uncharacterized protein n=1 Tax=Heterostelium pallidum (strain ATCC 26659 / Pp 5 / PN500) TaxID=670386 RepID=D3BCF5_HETP5|nr:hypothetical protein PPL_06180 [Heterostelium album PN500]EFA80945.1 hypothetical protein PPL_06180 [Heterostelium album PN500]|eukprot:XP_020433063.1 hypothetical protein PPL_06180 [Heterostelium album PN500]